MLKFQHHDILTAKPICNANMSTKTSEIRIHLIGGALAGLAETISTQPIDIIKTRQQLFISRSQQHGTYAPVHDSYAPKSNLLFFRWNNENGMWSIMRSIRQEAIRNNRNAFLQFYRGVLPPIMSIVPSTCVMFVCNEQAKRWMHSLSGHSSSSSTSLLAAITAGALSGLPEAVILTPFELIKVRLQSKQYLGHYRNTQDCFRKMIRQEGVSSLFRGLTPTILRNCVWNGAYFGLIHMIKPQLPKPESVFEDMAISFVSGSVSGTFATIFNTPFDVVKSRIQNEIVPISSSSIQTRIYRNTSQSLLYLYRTEGFSSLYKGFLTKVLKMSVGGGVSIAVFEAICSLYNMGNKF
jgi:solute carrier family 25 2-oxodicarboxylate transporter 21